MNQEDSSDQWETADGFRWQRLDGEAKMVECPACFYQGRDDDGSGMLADTRNGTGILFGVQASIISIGYLCPRCGHVFGHAPDIQTASRIASTPKE